MDTASSVIDPGSSVTGPVDAALSVIDVDTHLTEPHDLWTSRAPCGVPRPGAAGPRRRRDRRRGRSTTHRSAALRPRRSCTRTAPVAAAPTSSRWTFDDAHPAAYDVPNRLEVMDSVGVWAQVVYPNAAGFGGQRFGGLEDRTSSRTCARPSTTTRWPNCRSRAADGSFRWRCCRGGTSRHRSPRRSARRTWACAAST